VVLNANTYYILDVHLSSTHTRFVITGPNGEVLNEAIAVSNLTTATRLSLIATMAAPGVATPIVFLDYMGFGTTPLYIK
jgi:hypothetical protein